VIRKDALSAQWEGRYSGVRVDFLQKSGRGKWRVESGEWEVGSGKPVIVNQ